MGQAATVPVTYAGGARNLSDLERVAELSNNRVDLTIGSALDIFGGQGVNLDACIQWNRTQQQS
jgi:phosphoribosylformimino-5-aminoimidazole carboxamide ribotide isomerase